MGRYLKNAQLKTGASHAIQVPLSTSAGGPDIPVQGQLRFNTTVGQLEWFYNGQWWDTANRGNVAVVIETFTGDQFVSVPSVGWTVTLTNSVSTISDFMVFIGGIYQIPTVHYSFINGSSLVLTSAPPTVDAWGNPNYITIVHNLNSTNAVYG